VLVLHAEMMEFVSYQMKALIALVHRTFLGIVVKVTDNTMTKRKSIKGQTTIYKAHAYN
jgi:hypothetical protein